MTRTERKEPLCVDGEMTIYTATEIKLRLMEALTRAERLEVDLSAVTEVDTAGVQLLILAKQEAVRLGKSLHYLNHSVPVVEILEFCNLTGRFDDPIVPADNR